MQERGGGGREGGGEGGGGYVSSHLTVTAIRANVLQHDSPFLILLRVQTRAGEGRGHLLHRLTVLARGPAGLRGRGRGRGDPVYMEMLDGGSVRETEGEGGQGGKRGEVRKGEGGSEEGRGGKRGRERGEARKGEGGSEEGRGGERD